jgi:hypothetical protein
MSQSINIVKLIEENPNTKLSKSYQGKLINKLKDSFSTDEQQLFISSFYCYLNYKSHDFMIDLDDIWSWLGFTRKDNTKRLLEKYFKPDIDFKIVFLRTEENSSIGRPSEKIMLSIKTFKKMCLKANTSKANEIHEYYIKLEETLHEVIDEESNELRLQLQEKDDEIRKINDESNSKLLLVEEQNRQNICKTLIRSFDNKNLVYIGYIGKINDCDSYKFGSTKKISKRVKDHEKTYERFDLLFCIECEKHTLLEQYLKDSKDIKKRRFSHPFHVENKKTETDVTELLKFDDEFNLDDLKKLLAKLKNNVEMSCELRLEIEKTTQKRLDAEIIHNQEETKLKQIELEEETKRLAKELEEQTKQKQIELEILKLKLAYPDEIREINEENKNEEIRRIEEELTSKIESEREVVRQIQENNNKIFEERIDSIASHLIDVNIFENIYKPIQITYNDRNTFLYIAKINDELYINVNSISEKSYPMDRWKRGSEVKRKIVEYNFKLQDKKMLSIYSHKNKGTWILFDFFCKNYFNWYGSIYNKVNNNSCYLNFGTFLEIQLPKLIDEYDISTDKHFIQIKRGEAFFKVRANRENNFINVTDLFNAHDRDVRTFNKNSERKNYFVTNPEDHYLNGNDITDEFGMKVTFCHPKLAIVIVDWLYKKNDNNEEKQQILDFINYFMDKV